MGQTGDCGPLRQRHEGGQAFAHHVGVRQSRVLRQDFPVRREKRRRGRRGLAAGRFGGPRFHVLLKDFLGFQPVSDCDNGPVGEKPGQQDRFRRLDGAGMDCELYGSDEPVRSNDR